MFQSQDRGAGAASNLPPANAMPLSPRPERVRHLVYGSLAGIDRTIKLLHRLGYAEPNDWSPPLPVPSAQSGAAGQDPQQPIRDSQWPIQDPQRHIQALQWHVQALQWHIQDPQQHIQASQWPNPALPLESLGGAGGPWMVILTKTWLLT